MKNLLTGLCLLCVHFLFAQGSVNVSCPVCPPSLTGVTDGWVLTDSSGRAVWQPVSAPIASDSSWGLLGNSGTSSATNFIGTTDDMDLRIRVNNLLAGKIEKNNNTSTSFGYRALQNETDASNGSNAAFGYQSGVGITTGVANTALGWAVMTGNDVGSRNTAIGWRAMNQGAGDANVCIGYAAGYYELGSNKLFIDNRTRANQNDARVKALVYGVFSNIISEQKFTINGVLQVNDSTQGAGKVLTSDASGNAQWGSVIDEGYYIPADSANINTSVVTWDTAYYSRNGNMVIVSGLVTVQATASVTSTFFEVSLPIGTHVTTGRGYGILNAITDNLQGGTTYYPWTGRVYGNSNGKATFGFSKIGSSIVPAGTFSYIYQYKIE